MSMKKVVRFIPRPSGLDQGSPAFLKLRATACGPINVKGYYFDTHFWNKNFAQVTINYISIDIRLCNSIDHANVIFRTARGRPTSWLY